MENFELSNFNYRTLLPHLGIVAIASLVILSNVVYQDYNLAYADEGLQYSTLSASETVTALEQISPYTFFEEDMEETQLTLEIQQESDYLDKEISTVTEESKLEKEYIIQKGDTISTIASKFDMHVASILDRNGIAAENAEKLSAGQKLIIPAKDTSDSKEWLVKLNEKKEQERKAAAKQLALKKAQDAKKKTVALSKRSTVYRDRSGYEGAADGSWAQPISYKYISRGISGGHSGIDMIAGTGAPVYASKSGKVVETTGSWGGGYGLSILIDHGGGQTSRYAHLSSFAVGGGDYVGQGQVIGYSGNTGWSTGPHLHFEARQNSVPFNPF